MLGPTARLELGAIDRLELGAIDGVELCPIVWLKLGPALADAMSCVMGTICSVAKLYAPSSWEPTSNPYGRDSNEGTMLPLSFLRCMPIARLGWETNTGSQTPRRSRMMTCC